MRGRKPASQVTPGKGSHAPDCPAWLDDEARREWARVVPAMGVCVQQVDLAVIAAYCSTWSMWSALRSKLTADSIAVNNKLNPEARYCESLLKQLRGLLDQLGFTPASRRQVLQGESPQATLEDVLR